MEFYERFMTTLIFSGLVRMVGKAIVIASICLRWRVTKLGVGEKYDIRLKDL